MIDVNASENIHAAAPAATADDDCEWTIAQAFASEQRKRRIQAEPVQFQEPQAGGEWTIAQAFESEQRKRRMQAEQR